MRGNIKYFRAFQQRTLGGLDTGPKKLKLKDEGLSA